MVWAATEWVAGVEAGLVASGAAKFRIKKSTGFTYDLLAALDITEAFVVTKDLDFGDPMTSKLIQRLFFEIEGRSEAPELTLLIVYRNDLETDTFGVVGPIKFGGTAKGAVTVRVPAAKYFRFHIGDTAVRKTWKLAAFEVWGETASARPV